MPKINPHAILAAALAREEVTLTTSDGQTDTIALLEPDLSTKLRAREIAEDLWQTYAIGDGDGNAPALPIPDIKPSRALFTAAALVAEMQEEPVYTVLDLICLFWKDERVFEQIQGPVNRLGLAAEARLKN